MVAQAVDVRVYAMAVALAADRLSRLDRWFGPDGAARPNQRPPDGDWRTWLVLAGRGFGKTRTGAEWVRDQVQHHGARRVAIVGPTSGDARDVMVQGESGLLAVCDRYGFRPQYQPSLRRLTFPNGAVATTFSADEPDRLRGPQHDLAWSDELAAWRYPDAWDMLQFGLRLGDNPRQIATTTPRPVKVVRDLIASASSGSVAITRGSTFENRDNLAPTFLDELTRRYAGTRMGRQEIEGELLEDVEGALWQRLWLDRNRVAVAPPLARVVVAIDPAATSGEDADQTGIVAAGVAHGRNADSYVLHAEGVRLSPDGWAGRAIHVYDTREADAFIVERNNGGEMVEHTLRTAWASRGRARQPLRVITVHASRGKTTRAEPIAALDEQGRAHHVGSLPVLEDEMCSFVPGLDNDADDLVDARVYALTELNPNMLADRTAAVGSYLAPRPEYDGRGLAGRW